MLDASKYLGERLVERYHIKKEIGKGASSLVFYAEDMMTKTDDGTPLPVALKILDKDSNEYKINSKSFYTETCAVVGMPTNAHTVAVKDVSYDADKDVHFIVMEYVKGTTLRRYMSSRGSFSSREIISVALQVLDALRVAHGAKVVHRDVKPQNILVQDKGESGNVAQSLPGGKDMPYVKLADFGIALLPGEDLFKMADRGVGTVHYISPEQASGDSVDARSDLYSLGVVMYELATGHVPFDADSATAVITKHQADAATHVRALNPAISLSLDRIIFTAMQKDPAKRYKDAAAMEKRLKEALAELDGAPAAVMQKTPEHKKYKKPRERRKGNGKKIFATLGAVLGVAAIASFLVVMIPKWLHDDSASITVPSFVGTVYDESAPMPEGLTVLVKEEYDDTVPKGTVIEQSHGAGLVVKGTLTVTVTVSLGPEPLDFELPEAFRETFEKARNYIKSLIHQTPPKKFIVSDKPLVLPYDAAKGALGAVIGVRLADGTEVSLSGGKVVKNASLVLVTNGWGEHFELPSAQRVDTHAGQENPLLSYNKAKDYIEKEYEGKIVVSSYVAAGKVDAAMGTNFYTDDSKVPMYSVVGAINDTTGEIIELDGTDLHIPTGSALGITLIINAPF